MRNKGNIDMLHLSHENYCFVSISQSQSIHYPKIYYSRHKHSVINKFRENSSFDT